EEPIEKPKRAKKPAKKSTTVPTSCVVIRDTPSESVPKKKTPAKEVKGKCMDILSNVALLEVAQLKKTLKKSKLETHKHHASYSASDSEKTNFDEDENPNLNQNDDEEEEYEEEYVHTPDSIDFTDDDEEYMEITTYEQVKDDKHVILTTVHDTQKTEVPFQSSFVSSDFENQFLNLDNVMPTDTELVSMMNVKVRHEEPSNQTPSLLNIHVTILPKEVSYYATPVIQSCITKSCENIDLAKCSSQPKSTYEAAASLTEIELKKILFDKIQKSKSYRGTQESKYLYDALVKSNKLDKYLFESYAKIIRKVCSAEKTVFEALDTEMPLNPSDDLGNTDDQPNVKAASKDDWFMKPKRSLTSDSDWNTTKTINFRPPQTWISKFAKAKKPPPTFDKPMSTAIDLCTYVSRGDCSSKRISAALQVEGRNLHNIASSLRMDYLPKRRWSNLYRKRHRIMIKTIDQQLFKRRLMRNSKKFVGRRDYGNDLRLIEWII
nr:hypothetical protein [Tanacetum cinerariifolium]